MGQLKNGLMNGYGEFLWPDGKKYFGFYQDDNKHGFGIFLWSSNPIKVYIGFWSKGKQSGLGIMVNGKSIKFGLWLDGKKEFFFQSAWEMKKYAKNENLPYNKFIQKDVNEIIEFILN
jgi:hypothetical protein